MKSSFTRHPWSSPSVSNVQVMAPALPMHREMNNTVAVTPFFIRIFLPTSYFDYFRFVFCLCSMKPIVYAISNEIGARVHCVGIVAGVPE